MKREIVLIVHNVRSTHNVGSLLRTADGLGVSRVYLTGYTPYPAQASDERLPHLATKIDRQIAKTALGAEKSVEWRHNDALDAAIGKLRGGGFELVALEQAPEAQNLASYKPSGKIALIVGNEVDGLSQNELKCADKVIEIRMLGQKESLNVAIAAGIALHHLRNA